MSALFAIDAIGGGLVVNAVIAYWQTEANPVAPTPERIARQVARHFRLDPRALQTRRRQPAGLWPCQVGMFLTRELTGLPWARIIHGKGTGTLRRQVRELLSKHPLVASYEQARLEEGGEGVTIAHLAL